MKILFDHQKFSIQKYGGITRYFCELMMNFSTDHQYELSVLLSDNYYLKENYSSFRKRDILPEREVLGKSYIKQKIYSLNRAYSRRCIQSEDYDVFHPTYYDTYFLDILKKPYVITVHDLIHFRFNEKFLENKRESDRMGKVIRGAARIIAISESTKSDIVELLQIDPTEIDVIYHGFNENYTKTSPDTSSEFILFVGERHTYKNFNFFIKAISSLLHREKSLRLICVGPPFTREENLLLQKLKLTEQVKSVRVSNEELNNLYASALVFVFPSLYEGFGMPILEAFSNDCPVCLSNNSSFPEIAAEAALYFDPRNLESILATVESMVYDSELAQKKVKAGRERLKSFSWKNTASKTFTTYSKVI